MLVALHRRAGWAWRRQLVAALLLAASCGAPAQEAGGCPDYNPLRNVYTGATREIDGVALLTYATARVADDALATPLRAAGLV